MNLLDHFRRMARNNRWSNDRLYRAVRALEAGEFEAPRTSFFPSIKETLNHILAVDLYYLDAMEESGGGSALFQKFSDIANATVLGAEQEDFDKRLIAFCDGLTADDLDRRVVTDRAPHDVRERLGDLLAHLFVHQIHHRGQAHAMLSGTPVKPPQLDEFFLDFDHALRREEVERLKL